MEMEWRLRLGVLGIGGGGLPEEGKEKSEEAERHRPQEFRNCSMGYE